MRTRLSPRRRPGRREERRDRWHNKIARATGDVLTTIEVGQAPTHTVTNPNETSPHLEHLTLPWSAQDIFLELDDPAFGALQKIIDNDPTG